jgi:hypothetical protein
MPLELEEIDLEEAAKTIENLAETLEEATPEEKKALMQENVAEIRIPKKEEPLLVSNPEGLLRPAGCFFCLVTPRGTAMEATTLMFCGMPLLVVVQQPTVLLRFYDSTYHRQHQH